MFEILVLFLAPTLAAFAAALTTGYQGPQAIRVLIGLGCAVPVGISQYYTAYRPSLRLKASVRHRIIKSILNDLKQELCERNSVGVEIRLNVMEVQGFPLWNRRLKIVACCGEHSKAEQEISWRMGEGACGYAWKEKKQILSPDPRSLPHTSMSGTQLEICRNVKCVLSTPIKPKLRGVKGVLNVDSKRIQSHNAPLTSNRVQDILQTYADVIADLY